MHYLLKNEHNLWNHDANKMVKQPERDLSEVRKMRLEMGLHVWEGQVLSPHSRDNTMPRINKLGNRSMSTLFRNRKKIPNIYTYV